MPESKNRFYVSPYLENRIQGDAQLFVITRTFQLLRTLIFNFSSTYIFAYIAR